MNILLSPFSSEDTLTVLKNGQVLVINGEELDFSPMADGDTLPAAAITSAVITSPVEFIDGHLVITLRFPNPINASPEQRFPVPLMDVPDGLIALPLPLPEVPSETASEEQA